jgi:short-subunit dehydrogenase
LFTNFLSKKLKKTNVLIFSVHPGLVNTEIWRNLPFFLRPLLKLRRILSPEEGARTSIHCILNASVEDNGKYFSNEKLDLPSTLALNQKLALKLWEKSVEWTKNFID